MKKIIFKGCGTAVATPFTEDGINYDEFAKLLENQVNQGADAIIVCGTTGEASTMSDTEKKEIIKFTVKFINNRIPVIAGTGGNNTKEVIKMCKYAQEIGTDGVLVVTPYYNKTTQNGLLEHYGLISKNIDLPIILYNVPGRTGINIEPETCRKLSEIDNIVAIKEASGNISQVAKIANICGDNLKIYSGNDDQILPVLSLGGIGVISVLANVESKYIHKMVYNYFNGKVEESTNMQLQCLNFVNNLFAEVNPIPVKSCLNMYGYNFGAPRLPLIEMDLEKMKKMEKAIIEFKLIRSNFC